MNESNNNRTIVLTEINEIPTTTIELTFSEFCDMIEEMDSDLEPLSPDDCCYTSAEEINEYYDNIVKSAVERIVYVLID